MKRVTGIYQVKTYNADLRNELGGEGLYFSFGYEGTIAKDMVCVFCRETGKYTTIMTSEARTQLRYYDDEPMDNKFTRKLIKEFNNNTGYNIK